MEWLTWQMTIASLYLQVAIELFSFISFKDLPLETLVLSLFSPWMPSFSHTVILSMICGCEHSVQEQGSLSCDHTSIGITECAKCIAEMLKCDNVGMLFQTWRDMMTLTPNLRKIICLVTVDLVCLLLVGIPCLLLWLVGKSINPWKYSEHDQWDL